MTDFPEHYFKPRINWGVIIPAFGVMMAIMVQTATIAWLMSGMYSGISDNQKHIDRVEKLQASNYDDLNTRVNRNQQSANMQAVQLGRIDENVKSVKGILGDIRSQLEVRK